MYLECVSVALIISSMNVLVLYHTAICDLCGCFPDCLINDTICPKKLLNEKYVLNITRLKNIERDVVINVH
jgi:hypothetical protein